MKVYKPEWRCTFNVSEDAEESASWKARLAWRLRKFADRMDGDSRTFKLECNLTPEISQQDFSTCLGKGFEVTHSLLTQLAHQAACEDVMRDAKAELYEEGEQR
ncbi:hypothetical protein [Litchfieldella xinjiangensis]|uniref:hypothetical protein n=1 Tax=Litchfieldella xinjiangensis TaxID=1166948 RepID=UPI0005BC8880|nr:hypothetical protein [Halomonas xinjiangensis]